MLVSFSRCFSIFLFPRRRCDEVFSKKAIPTRVSTCPLNNIRTMLQRPTIHSTKKRLTLGSKQGSAKYAMFDDEAASGSSATCRVRLRRVLTGTRAGYVIDVLNLFFSVLSSLLYIAETYEESADLSFYTILDALLCAFFIADYSIRLFVASSRLGFVLSFYAIIDLLSIAPSIIIMHFYWLQSVEMASLPLYLSIMKVMRILRILRVERFLIYLNSEVNQVLGEIFLRGISAAIFSAGVIQVVDNNWREMHWMQTLPFHDYIYFVLVSLSTVGYGDINPESSFSKLFIVTLVLGALYYIPKSTNKLIRIMNLKSVYATNKYKPRSSESKHVVVTGDLNSLDENFFVELFHDDHGEDQLECVVLGEGNPTGEIEKVLRNQSGGFGSLVTYLDGSPLNMPDLQRAAAVDAEAIFVLGNKFADDSDEMDAATILRALTIKRYVLEKAEKDSMLCIQLLRPENQTHYAACGNMTLESLDQVVCMDEIKMTLLAKTTLCPGMTALIANLITSDEDDSEDAASSSQTPEWLEEYTHGQGFEIYKTTLSAAFAGISFAKAAEIVYNITGVLLFAVEVHEGAHPRIYLNPGSFLLPNPHTVNVHGFCIAQDKSSIEVLNHPNLLSMYRDYIKHDRVTSRSSSYIARKRRNSRVQPTTSEEAVIDPNDTKPIGLQLAEQLGKSSKKAELELAMKRAKEEEDEKRQKEEIDNDADESGAGSPASESTPKPWTSMTRSNTLFRHACRKTLKRSRSSYFETNEPVRVDDVTIKTSLRHDFPHISKHILITGNVSNIHYFVKTLRAKHLDRYSPIVILTPNKMPTKVWEKVESFPDVFFCQGSPVEEASLIKAGGEDASCAVILTGSRSSSSLSLADADTIFTYQGIKRINPSIRIVTELVEHTNIDFLDADVSNLNTSATLSLQMEAAGCVYVSSMLDTLICQSFYNPSITRVLSKLVAGTDPVLDSMPNKEEPSIIADNIKESHLFSIQVPDNFVDKRYADLFAYLIRLEEKLLPIGILRGVWGTLKLGPLGNRKSYMYTNPERDVKLFKGDSVFVLAPRLPEELQRREDISDVAQQLFTHVAKEKAAGVASEASTESVLAEIDALSGRIGALRQQVVRMAEQGKRSQSPPLDVIQKAEKLLDGKK